ncbi:MAG: hypothetical protein JNJ83_17170 [Verrucomicrobiaceae bacterium]|nr:hypothetical protein [Verrucomicrobiaceae bacterium]
MKTRIKALLVSSMLAITGGSALYGQADFPYAPKTIAVANRTLATAGVGSYFTTAPAEASTTSGGDSYWAAVVSHSSVGHAATFYAAAERAVVESKLGNWPSDLTRVYDLDSAKADVSAFTARVPRSVPALLTVHRASTIGSNSISLMLSKRQPLIQLKSGSSVIKSWTLLDNSIGGRFSVSTDRWAREFTVSSSNRYVLQFVGNTSATYPQRFDIIAAADLPKWYDGITVGPKLSITLNTWDKALVLPAGRYAMVARATRGLFKGAVQLLEYVPTPTSSWKAVAADFPYRPVVVKYSKSLTRSGADSYMVSTAPISVKAGSTFSALGAGELGLTVALFKQDAAVTNAFTAYLPLSNDPRITFARSTSNYFPASVSMTAAVSVPYVLGVRSFKAGYATNANVLLSRNVDVVKYAAAGLSKTWIRQANPVLETFSVTSLGMYLRSFTITSGSRYAFRFVTDEATRPEHIDVIARKDLIRLKLRQAVTSVEGFTGKHGEFALSLAPGDYVMVGMASSGKNSAAYELIEYR